MIRTPTPEEEDGLRAQVKAEIRERRRQVRRALPPEARDARSARICDALTRLPEWERARTVVAFVSMRTEVQTRAAIEAAWAAGKTVAVPRMTEARDELELRILRPADVLEESGMMFLQPADTAPRLDEAEADLVVVPALAVDGRGYRIGYGKGFYDRLLPRLPRALRVGVIFDFERIAEVPERAGDVPVHAIVTDARVERCPPLT